MNGVIMLSFVSTKKQWTHQLKLSGLHLFRTTRVRVVLNYFSILKKCFAVKQLHAQNRTQIFTNLSNEKHKFWEILQSQALNIHNNSSQVTVS